MAAASATSVLVRKVVHATLLLVTALACQAVTLTRTAHLVVLVSTSVATLGTAKAHVLLSPNA